VDDRAGMDAVARKENPIIARESNLGRPAYSLVIILTELPRINSYISLGTLNVLISQNPLSGSVLLDMWLL
jgi:hypothetical protein